MIVKCTSQIAVSILLLFAIFMDVKAQTPSFDCPSDFDVFNWTPETTVFRITNDNNSTGSATLGSHWLQGGGNTLIVLIDWSTFTNNLKPLPDSVVKEMLLLNMAEFYHFPGENCNVASNDVYTVKFVSKAPCTKEMSCLSELAFDDAIHCDNHNLASKYIILNGRAFWRELYTQECGFKCCLVEMRFKCAVSPVTGNIVPTFLPRNYITTSNCPTSTTYRCTDGIVPPPPPEHVPCEGDCQKGELE